MTASILPGPPQPALLHTHDYTVQGASIQHLHGNWSLSLLHADRPVARITHQNGVTDVLFAEARDEVAFLSSIAGATTPDGTPISIETAVTDLHLTGIATLFPTILVGRTARGTFVTATDPFIRHGVMSPESLAALSTQGAVQVFVPAQGWYSLLSTTAPDASSSPPWSLLDACQHAMTQRLWQVVGVG
ncbi:hypothetical protein [Deinococcus multiflagellatus]|uniref:Uncharacterized protein n=1 Tax=Deinococcus multiflagellatus TaxID=1656887 RepID=A0ABW1ZTA2_9DEIO|nr:hypothetical protein [Deinococcus multiflagellatus]MBZ9715985.1 hypothetical protein [Deinococcus multiflagellatus]